MSIKNVAIERYSKDVYELENINKKFIKIKQPDGSILRIPRDDEDFIMLTNVTASEISRFIDCIQPRIMPREVFERSPKVWNMTYEEYKQCYCPECLRKECLFYDKQAAIRARMPKVDKGLGLCLNLKNNISTDEKLKLQAEYLNLK